MMDLHRVRPCRTDRTDMRELFILAWAMFVGGVYGALAYHWFLTSH